MGPPPAASLIATMTSSCVNALVRAGVGAPGPGPTGLILIETIGRRSGARRELPLLATVIGDIVLVATLRSRSQWIRNIAARPRVRYWMGGRMREARALVVAPWAAGPPAEAMQPLAASLGALLAPWCVLTGAAFAMLIPDHGSPA